MRAPQVAWFCSAHWPDFTPALTEEGLRAIAEVARRSPSVKNESFAIEVFCKVAAGENLDLHGLLGPVVNEAVALSVANIDVQRTARALLSDLILDMESDDTVAARAGLALIGFGYTQSKAGVELIAAISRRWFAVSTPVLKQYEDLISDSADDESEFQRFLEAYPQLLDPLALTIWPQPDLFGFKEPDFVIQRTDGTYLVVEIECPSKKLLTAIGQLSSSAGHAEFQALEYRRHLMEKIADVRIHFPEFKEPDCLVVVGLERDLNPKQRDALHMINRGRNHVRIVGFDWLLERAKTIASNVTQHSAEVKRNLRIV
ncbi:Shedu anti-phage system protein SduA domain-containing protein [Rhizobium leguminosarum]|uniref:Shedu anti-phage system protein SduA domain-containing protein n=1 Tax=Rhizobium leguminosarum TaxID=384 RepID=UPI001AE51E90|nr:Shedu anti-phage system protein SduA domain-containing protein [Rhizobium leguminosarum]MBP2444978.1 hypothetical protein [Rhizobium leguminosarum]